MQAAPATRPNILWICTDQQRFDTLASYGNPFVRTPNLDRLAENGALFNRSYTQSPICSPSRSSFPTGRYPRTTRVRQNGQNIPTDDALVTRLLADAGYICGLVGKLHITAGDAAGRRSDALVEAVDIAPTLLDVAGLPGAPGMQGVSLWPLLSGRADLARHREDVYSEYYSLVTRHMNGSSSHPPALRVWGNPQAPAREGCQPLWTFPPDMSKHQ